jgi:hypothetical protein
MNNADIMESCKPARDVVANAELNLATKRLPMKEVHQCAAVCTLKNEYWPLPFPFERISFPNPSPSSSTMFFPRERKAGWVAECPEFQNDIRKSSFLFLSIELIGRWRRALQNKTSFFLSKSPGSDIERGPLCHKAGMYITDSDILVYEILKPTVISNRLIRVYLGGECHKQCQKLIRRSIYRCF